MAGAAGAAGAGLAASCFGWRGRSGGRTGAVGIDHRDDGLNGHGLPFGDLNFFQHAGRRRRNFRVDFVGGNFEQRLVALDLVAGLLQPFGDGAFENTFAHLGHDDVDSHGPLLELRIPRNGAARTSAYRAHRAAKLV